MRKGIMLVAVLAVVFAAKLATCEESAWDLRAKGFQLQQEGKLKKAIDYYRKAAKAQPEEPTFHNDLGIAYEFQGDAKSAEKEYLKAIEANPNFLMVYTNLGALYARAGRIVDAAYYFKMRMDLSTADDPWLQKIRDFLAMVPEEVMNEVNRRIDIAKMEKEAAERERELAQAKAAEETGMKKEEQVIQEASPPENKQAKRIAGIVLTNTDLKTRYEVIGIINATVTKANMDEVNQLLRSQAYDLNADAVVLVNYFTSGNKLCGYGTAVKLLKE